jgi:hypothetical protein
MAQTQFQSLMHDNAAMLSALTVLRHIRDELADAVDRLCPEGANAEAWRARYDDGRAVMSAIPMVGPATHMRGTPTARTR